MKATNPYDEVPYPNNPLTASHPDRLAAVGVLHGLHPARAERCRVLELGCGAGANLCAMALMLPDSQFVGLDLAEHPIRQGQQLTRELGLRNLTLQQRDILAAGPDLGQFDFVIAHGVYSWVPAAVRDRLLALTREVLTENGIAYVSYIVYPGAYHRRMVREILMHHAGDCSGRERIERGREILDFLADVMPLPEGYRLIFKEERNIWERYGAEYYLHDNLADDNHPIWFREFVAHAGRHGLQYLSDLASAARLDQAHMPDVVRRLDMLSGPDRIAREQYGDFLLGRMFRQTLLCRAGLPITEAPRAEHVRQLCAMSPGRPVTPQPDLQPGVVVEFRTPAGEMMQTSHPLAKAAVCVLGQEWPLALPFADLVQRAAAMLGPEPANDAAELELAEFLLIADSTDFARLLVTAPRWSRTVTARPVASPLARWQAARGVPVTNVCHQTLRMDDPVIRQLICLLDGTREHPLIIEDLAVFMAANGLELRQQGTPVTDGQMVRTLLTAALEANLAKLARACLLVG